MPHRTPGARGTDAASSPRRAKRARRRDRLSFRAFFFFLHRQQLHHARERAFASRTPRHSRRASARHRRSSRRERRRWPARMLRCIRRLYRVSLPSPSPSRTSSRRVLMDTDSEEWPALGHRAAGRGVHVRFDAPTPMDRDVAPPSRALPRARADRAPGSRPPRRGGTRDSAGSRREAEAEATTEGTNTDTAATRVASRLALSPTPRRRRGAGWTDAPGSRRPRTTTRAKNPSSGS